MNTVDFASVWYNPLKYPATIELITEPTRPPQKIVIASGARREIPSMYDKAIQVLNSDKNQVIGGLAPNLVKVAVHNLAEDKLEEIPEESRAKTASFLRMPDSDYLPTTKAESTVSKSDKK